MIIRFPFSICFLCIDKSGMQIATQWTNFIMNFKKNKVGIFLEWSLMYIMFAYKLNCMMPKEHKKMYKNWCPTMAKNKVKTRQATRGKKNIEIE